MLIVMTAIKLKRSHGDPIALGGDIDVRFPWKISEAALSPIAYSYSVDGDVGTHETITL